MKSDKLIQGRYLMRDKYNTYLIGMTALGTIGLFTSFLTAFPGAVNPFLALLIFLILFPVVIYVVYQPRKQVLWLFLAVIIIFLILNITSVTLWAQALYNGIVDTYSANDNYVFPKYIIETAGATDEIIRNQWLATKALLTCFMLYTMMAAILIRHNRHSMLVALLTALLFIPTILYLTKPFLLSLMMVLAFIIQLICLSRLKRFIISKETLVTVLNRVMLCSMVVCVLLMVLMPRPLYQINQRVESLKTSILLKIESLILNQTTKEGEVNLRDANNRVYTYATHLKLTSTVKQQIFLKQYSGEVFIDDTWKLLSNEQRDNKVISWSKVIGWIDAYRKSANKLEYDQLEITDQRIDPMYIPQPYYLSLDTVDPAIMQDTYRTVEKGKDTYHYSFLSDNNLGEIGYIIPEPAYITFIKRYYTEIPREIKQLFDELGIDRQMASDKNNAYSAYSSIRQYLAEHADYTLTPGGTPKEKEFVSYFLKENKKGYCVHFATTATLMFRYLGIPACYVEGYRIDTTRFDEDGNANVKDSDAHAWVEIFDEEKGWVPLEVTPAASLNNNNPEHSDSSNQQTTQNPDQTQGNQNNEQIDPTEKDANGNQVSNDAMDNAAKTEFHLEILIPIAIVIAALAAVVMRRQMRYSQNNNKICQKNRNLAIVHLDLLLDIWRRYGEIDTTQIQPILDKALYSRHRVSEEEYRVVYQFYLQTKIKITKQQKLYNKIKIFIWEGI